MSNNQIIKRVFEEEFKSDKIKRQILTNYERKRKKNMLKMWKYALPVCVIAIICGVLTLNDNQNQLKSDIQNINNNIVVNKMETLEDSDTESLKLDAEIKSLENIDEKTKFMESIKVPNGYKFKDGYMIYTKRNGTTKDYNILHDYVFTYKKDDVNNIIVAFSEVGKPIRDYYLNENAKVSKIENIECKIYQYLDDVYMVTFSIDDMNFDIETSGITENELVKLIKSIIIKKSFH